MNKKNLIKKLYNGNKLNFVVLTILSLLSTIPSMVISIMLERIISIAYEKDLQALIDQGIIFLILMAALVLGYIINIYIKPKYKKKAMSQYKQNIYNFYKTQNLSNPQVEKDIERIEAKHIQDIEFIHDYYLNKFNHDVDDKSISRLNGWALHLKGLDNEEVCNLPLLLTHSIEDLVKDVQEMFKSLNLMNIADFVQGYYEESCAYSHVTPYAFFNSLKIYGSNALIKEQFVVINLLIVQLYSKIIQVLDLDENDPDLRHVEVLLINSLMTLVMDLKKQK